MDGWRHMATDEGYSRILTNIGEALRADMRGLIEEPPPRAILLQVLHLIRREQELRGMQHAIESSHTVDIEKFVPKASIDDRLYAVLFGTGGPGWAGGLNTPAGTLRRRPANCWQLCRMALGDRPAKTCERPWQALRQAAHRPQHSSTHSAPKACLAMPTGLDTRLSTPSVIRIKKDPGSWRPYRNASTLGRLIENRIVLLVVCRRCKHEGLIFPADLVPRFGPSYPTVGVCRLLRQPLTSPCVQRSAP